MSMTDAIHNAQRVLQADFLSGSGAEPSRSQAAEAWAGTLWATYRSRACTTGQPITLSGQYGSGVIGCFWCTLLGTDRSHPP